MHRDTTQDDRLLRTLFGTVRSPSQCNALAVLGEHRVARLESTPMRRSTLEVTTREDHQDIGRLHKTYEKIQIFIIILKYIIIGKEVV